MEPVEPEQIPEPKKLNKKVLVKIAVAALVVTVSMVIYLLTKPEPKTNPASQTPAVLNPAQPKLNLFTKDLPSPTGIVSTNQPDDSRLFVLDQKGVVRVVSSNGTVQSKPFMDISSRVMFGGEMGLLGLAFSPNFSKDGFIFVNYVDKSQSTVIARYSVTSDKTKVDPASEKVLLTFKQPYTNHNGGDLVFGQDGYLYIAVGDGGSATDPQDRAQNLGSFFGKILRLDVSQSPYKIPPTNPFVNQSGKAPEVWAYGLRNPWRISFDRLTQELYIADVGQGLIEEVNVEPSGSKGGVNYGWRCYEGSKEFSTDGCQAKENYTFPAFEYDHNDGRCSITGGYVYRGEKYPALKGQYFYGDYCNGQLYWAKKQNDKYVPALALDTDYQISTFGQDSSGELYVADYATGNIYRIEDSAN